MCVSLQQAQFIVITTICYVILTNVTAIVLPTVITSISIFKNTAEVQHLFMFF